MNISVDKAGDLKIGRKKCRLYKKDEVVKVAKKYGIRTEKKTVKQLCGAIKSRTGSTNNVPLAKLYPQAAKKRTGNTNNVPLAKLYPQSAKKRAAKKATPSRKAAINKKIVTSFMKSMVTTNANIKKLRELNEKSPSPKPKPSKKAKPLTKEEATKRIKAMRGLPANNKFLLVNRLRLKQHSPRRVVQIAREMARLR
jgi:hypothetical protein